MSARPNLLFVITDQQRADTAAEGGPCSMPNVNALAARGARFERCYAPNPICSPSRASIFTGLLPHSHGVEDVTHAVVPPKATLAPGLPFWPRALHEAGYRTGYFGKWHVERSEALGRFGFDEHELELRLTGLPTDERSLASRRSVRQHGYGDALICGISDDDVTSTPEHHLFGRGIDFIERAARSEPSRPWALFIATEAPHDPYVPPAAYAARYDPAAIPRPESWGDDLADRPGIYRRLQRVWRDLEWSDFATATACYYALCTLLDDQLGRVLHALRETGQEERTVVVFTSDHGDYLGAHRLMLKGVPAFEEAYGVPLVMAGPGIRPGLTSSAPVSLLDLPRTIVSLTSGGAFPCHGRDLAPFLAGGPPSWRPEAYAEFHGQRFGYTQRIVWSERWKYVFNGFDEDELYDLHADPFELRNRASDPTARAELVRLATRMWAIVRATDDVTMRGAQYGMFRFAPVGPEAAEGARHAGGLA